MQREVIRRWAGAWSCVATLYVAAGVLAADETTPDTATSVVAEEFYVDDIKAAMRKHILARVDKNGIFHIHDDVADEDLALKFVKIHDPVRQIDGNTYFACTDFHVVGDEKKLYDLDFWMNPQTGELKVYEEKIHKEPRRSLLYGWYKQARYTFVNDRVVEIY